MRDSIAAFAGPIAAEDLQLPVPLPGAYVISTMRPPCSAITPIASRTARSARAVLETFRSYLRNVEEYNIIGTAMGRYADPPDKTFIVQRRDRILIISGRGGRMFKFAPLLGEETASVLTGAAAPSQLAQWGHAGGGIDAEVWILPR